MLTIEEIQAIPLFSALAPTELQRLAQAAADVHLGAQEFAETSVPGIFACGDVRLSPVKRVASAVGEGSMAIALVQQYLQHDAGAVS